MALDPDAADITAELAALYMRQSRLPEAIVTANQALKIAPVNREAHKVLGLVYAALADNGKDDARPTGKPDENVVKAIPHLEQALDHPEGEPDPNVRATLARLYMRTGAYDKAIPLLTALVTEEPEWRDGAMLLAGAYAGAGKNADAIAWLEQAAPSDPQLYPTLADFYEREHRWKDAAGAYAKALEQAPRNVELKTRYASALLNAGDPASVGKARDVLNDILTRTAERRPSAVPAVAGAAPARRSRRRRSHRAPRHQGKREEPVGLLRARRSARSAPAVPGGRRRAGAGHVEFPRAAAPTPPTRSACCCRTSGSPTSSSGSSTRPRASSKRRTRSRPTTARSPAI